MPTERPYHHGDLRRAVLDAAIETIGEHGVSGLSLRGLARQAGVSHAAPAHHFGDRAGLLTAIAVEGYRLLADGMSRSPDGGEVPADLREMGVRYVRFAIAHPTHFQVMFRDDLLRGDDPELTAARARTSGMLRKAVAGPPTTAVGAQAAEAAAAAWSLAHGFAVLWLGGSLEGTVGGRDPAEAFRSIAEWLTGGAAGSGGSGGSGGSAAAGPAAAPGG